VARRATRELLDSGAYASVRAEAEEVDGKIVVRIKAVARRLVAGVRVEGSVLDDETMLREAHIAVGAEMTAESLPTMTERARQFYVRHGFSTAWVTIDLRETDDPMRLAMVVRVEPGPARRITRRVFVHDGPRGLPRDLEEEIGRVERTYDVDAGDRVDEEPL